MTPKIHCVFALFVGGSLAAVGARAAVDMDEILAAEYAGIATAMCPSAASGAGGGGPMDDYAIHGVEPFQVFDNLYYVGMDNISAWALETSEGIILFEAMMVANWEETIVEGLQTLGLDPNDIEYIVIGHAHNDHWGGAAYLQERFGAEVLMGEPDWDHILTWPQIGRPAPIPNKGRGLRDGDTLTLGDTTVRFVATPGHTPGTISSLIPVRDGDDRHLAAYWGGPSMSFLDPAGLEQYISSTYRLQNAAPDLDVELTNHPWGDGTFIKAEALAAREPGDPHPFVTGRDGVQRWAEQLRICTREVLSEKRRAAL
ncbi:MAG TPA: MBL fold metallo-hydrolase [Gammaproteobacteria bacterium]|nr:MBL fold metallo-hydrolase [Gammaproteobacteria bacterium]